MAFERSDAPGSWQLPQGGLERDEEPDAAVWREVNEETGLDRNDLTFVDVSPDWVVYEWPRSVVAGRKGMGQAHRWYRFRLARPDVVPSPDGSEFTAWRWVERQWLIDHVIEFRRDAYRRMLGPDRA